MISLGGEAAEEKDIVSLCYIDVTQGYLWCTRGVP